MRIKLTVLFMILSSVSAFPLELEGYLQSTPAAGYVLSPGLDTPPIAALFDLHDRLLPHTGKKVHVRGHLVRGSRDELPLVAIDELWPEYWAYPPAGRGEEDPAADFARALRQHGIAVPASLTDNDQDGDSDRLDDDDDNDGMSDGYEEENSLDPKFNDAQEDHDRDRVINLHEAIAGTRADDPDSHLAIQQLMAPDGEGGLLCWSSVPGKTYTIWRTSLARDQRVRIASGVPAEAEGEQSTYPLPPGPRVPSAYYIEVHR